MSAPPWEDFVRSCFPGYVLPASAADGLTVEEASRFLERLTGRPHELSLLRAISTLAPRMEEVRRFTHELLPDLAVHLPSRTEQERREWRGGFQGRLELGPSLALWSAGHETRFVTSLRRRSFALPENVLLCATGARLLRVLTDLRLAKVLGDVGWAAEAHACEGRLRHLLSATVLRDVPTGPITPFHEEAAHGSRHPGHAAALSLHRALRAGLDSQDPAAIAAILARGALWPLDAPTRFELAVVLRLGQAIEAFLEGAEPGRWVTHRRLIRSDRREILAFERADGATVMLYYNQSHLDAGPVDTAARHYLGATGRLRPDATVVVGCGERRSAVVLEIKLTERQGYMLEGLHEAALYRLEYAAHLRGWPKAILVTSANVPGRARREDDVIAAGWGDWPAPEVVEGILAPVLAW
ncbi:MAG: hypothetical protein U0441_23835 [Polyangiaceae bacterium]